MLSVFVEDIYPSERSSGEFLYIFFKFNDKVRPVFEQAVLSDLNQILIKYPNAFLPSWFVCFFLQDNCGPWTRNIL